MRAIPWPKAKTGADILCLQPKHAHHMALAMDRRWLSAYC